MASMVISRMNAGIASSMRSGMMLLPGRFYPRWQGAQSSTGAEFQGENAVLTPALAVPKTALHLCSKPAAAALFLPCLQEDRGEHDRLPPSLCRITSITHTECIPQLCLGI